MPRSSGSPWIWPVKVPKQQPTLAYYFPQEARAIHQKEAPERAIRGLATAAQAKELREEGIELLSLPAPAVPKDKLH